MGLNSLFKKKGSFNTLTKRIFPSAQNQMKTQQYKLLKAQTELSQQEIELKKKMLKI